MSQDPPSSDNTPSQEVAKIQKDHKPMINKNTEKQDELLKTRFLVFCRRNRDKKKIRNIVEFDKDVEDQVLLSQIRGLNDQLLNTLLTIFVPSLQYYLPKGWRDLKKTPKPTEKIIKNMTKRDSLASYYGKYVKLFAPRDISKKNPQFTNFNTAYDNIMRKAKQDIPTTKKSQPLSKKQITELRKSFDLNTPDGLNKCIYFTFMVAGGLRNNEMHDLDHKELEVRETDVECIPTKAFFLDFQGSLKNDQGGLGDKPRINKIIYDIPDSPIGPFQLIEKLRQHQDLKENDFVLRKVNPNWKKDGKWYLNARMETVHIVKKECKKLGFKGKFRSHSLKKSTGTILNNANVPTDQIAKAIGNHSANNPTYIHDASHHKQAITNILLASPNKKQKIDHPSPHSRQFPQSPLQIPQSPQISPLIPLQGYVQNPCANPGQFQQFQQFQQMQFQQFLQFQQFQQNQANI